MHSQPGHYYHKGKKIQGGADWVFNGVYDHPEDHST